MRDGINEPSDHRMVHLKQLVFKRHVALRVQAQTRPHDIDHSIPLLAQCIDDRRPRRRQRGLEHIAQHTEDRMEALEVLVISRVRVETPLDPSHEFGDDDQIDDQRRGEQLSLIHI